jgi:calcium/calmodulin-dependent protein kinase I
VDQPCKLHAKVIETSQLTPSQQALNHSWLSGKTATDHDLLPELRRAKEARAKLRHAILAVSLKKRIAQLKDEETDSENDMAEAEEGVPSPDLNKPNLKEKLKGSVFREVVLAKVRDAKHKQEMEAEEAAAAAAKEQEKK